VPEGYLSDSEGMEDEEGHASKHKSHSSRSSKRVVIRKVVLGPFFQGEGDEDEVMKPFELQFLTGKIEKEGQSLLFVDDLIYFFFKKK
jgi:hypothetical protein